VEFMRELPFVWIFIRGRAAPLWGQMTAATAGVRHPIPGAVRHPFPDPWLRPPRCNGSKHARGARIQSTGALTCELEGGQGPTVQVCARLGSQFFTCCTALFRPHACRPALERDSPTAMARRGARECADPLSAVTRLRIRCADSLKPGFRSGRRTDRYRSVAESVDPVRSVPCARPGGARAVLARHCSVLTRCKGPIARISGVWPSQLSSFLNTVEQPARLTRINRHPGAP
jgi:hypothetical protein